MPNPARNLVASSHHGGDDLALPDERRRHRTITERMAHSRSEVPDEVPRLFSRATTTAHIRKHRNKKGACREKC